MKYADEIRADVTQRRRKRKTKTAQVSSRFSLKREKKRKI